MKLFSLCICIILSSCFSNEISVKQDRKLITVNKTRNKTELKNIENKFDITFQRSVQTSGSYNFLFDPNIIENPNKIDFSNITGNYYIWGEITLVETDMTTKYQIPLILYIPHFYCKIMYTVRVYDLNSKKLSSIKIFEVSKEKYLGTRFFSVDKTDPDLMLSGREKNSVIDHTINELSEEVVDYLKEVIK